LVEDLDCLQGGEGGSAGDARGDSVLQAMTRSLILCEIDSTKRVNGSARAREERGCPAWASGPPDIARIGVAPRRCQRASTRNPAAASRHPREKAKARRRGESGLFKEGCGVLWGLGFDPIDRAAGRGTVLRVESLLKVGDDGWG
jgi:hypothetical protein